MRRSRKIVIAVLYAATLVIAPMVYHWRPLVSSLALHATYEQGQSGPRDARVYRMLFRGVVFVELPEDIEGWGRWFLVDLWSRRVFFPTREPDRTPYLHYNHDMNLGVAVDNTQKHDDLWTVTWGDGEASWSYGHITVRLRGA